MTTTLAEVDAKLAQYGPALHANTSVAQDIARIRLNYWLDKRLELTHPPVYPEAGTR